jgi:hypothetical protein
MFDEEAKISISSEGSWILALKVLKDGSSSKKAVAPSAAPRFSPSFVKSSTAKANAKVRKHKYRILQTNLRILYPTIRNPCITQLIPTWDGISFNKEKLVFPQWVVVGNLQNWYGLVGFGLKQITPGTEGCEGIKTRKLVEPEAHLLPLWNVLDGEQDSPDHRHGLAKAHAGIGKEFLGEIMKRVREPYLERKSREAYPFVRNRIAPSRRVIGLKNSARWKARRECSDFWISELTGLGARVFQHVLGFEFIVGIFFARIGLVFLGHGEKLWNQNRKEREKKKKNTCSGFEIMKPKDLGAYLK